MNRLLLALLLSLLNQPGTRSEDWPQFRGPTRDGVLNDPDILQRFPKDGLQVRWRALVKGGHSSPIVASGRVYVTDLDVSDSKAEERVQCFDEKTGRILWVYRDEIEYPRSYDPTNPTGPCSTPIVESGRLYNLGSTGNLSCLDSESGQVVWRKLLSDEFRLIDQPNITPSPLIEGDLLIVVIGGRPDACVVAFDKRTGSEVWRALEDRPRAFSSPIVISAGGERQLIVWTPSAVTSLDPSTGQTWWRKELVTREDNAGASPVSQGDLLLVSGLMFRLDSEKPAATAIWPEKKTQDLRIWSTTCMPLIRGREIYAANLFGHLICFDSMTGSRLWETDKITGPEKYGAIHLIPNGDSTLLYTDEGNLIRARLERNGYEELSRVHVIDPTFLVRGRKLVWAPPAFANGHVFARNQNELVCASLTCPPRPQ